MTTNARNLANLLGSKTTISSESLPPDVPLGPNQYSTVNDLPLSNNLVGDIAFISSTNRLYIWNGSGWYNIAIINTSPSSITGSDSTYVLSTDGTPTIITLNSVDPEGLNLQWNYQVTSGSLTNGGGVTASVTQNNNTFTITPTTTEEYAGEFSLTFTASDGVNVVSTVSSFTLLFGVNYPLLSSLTYSSSVSTTNVAGAVGFNLSYVYGFSTTPDDKWVSIAGEYGPAIWEFTTPGTLSTLVKRYSASVPPTVGGNGGGGGTSWKSDGSKIYYMYESNGLKILSWNWNGTSLSGGAEIKSLTYPSGWSSGRSVTGMCFNSDGTSVFIVGLAIPYVYKYSVSTPYELSTISTSPAQTKNINWATDVVISPDDTYICWKEGYSNTWKQHLFNSSLDLSNTTQVASTAFANSGGTTYDTMPVGLRFKFDGSGVLIFDKQNDQIDEYLI